MPKIIVTSRYIKPNAHKRFGNYIKYIATREGVEKPIPKSKVNQELDREIFMNYLDSRPNSHGLFSETDTPIVLDKVAKEVANHNGAHWTHIVSLKREDAERMGYTDLEHWRDLVRRHISDIAAAQKIAPENIRWYAAFHNKETNPHVHIVVYSADGKQGYLTKKGIEKIRSAFANDIYKDELQNLYQQQTQVRDKLRSEAESVMKNLLSELQNNNQFDSQIEQLVLKLQSQLRNFKGKKVYGYMQSNVKKTVDQIVALLAENPVLKKMYEEWCALEQQKYETYTSAMQKFPPLEENKVFKPIKNAVINAVLEMEFSPEMFAEYGEDAFDETVETVSDKDLYIKWTAEYKSACTELYKTHDVSKAFELFQSEAEKGNTLATFDIGKMYRNGLLGEDNVPKADEYFQKALQGFLALEPNAKRLRDYVQYRIGKMYALGLGTEQDYTKAFGWFEKSAAAGNKFAQYSLGSLYFYGSGTPQNHEKAFEYYKLSADQDNAYACYETAKMLRDGIGVEENPEQTEIYFQKAYNGFLKITQDNPDEKILYRLGVMAFSGIGCDADRELGVEYIGQSAELGNDYAKVFLENADRATVQNAVTSMLLTFGRLVSDDYNRNLHGQKLRTERKLRAAIRRKKQALGMKENPLENPQFK